MRRKVGSLEYTKRSELKALELHRLEEPGIPYVTSYYVLMNGDANDPATIVEMRVAVFKAEDAPSELDITPDRYSDTFIAGALADTAVELISDADDQAERNKSEYEQLTSKGENRYRSYKQEQEQDLYIAFLDGIDRLAEDESDESAWAAVDAWRNRLAMKYEK